MKRSIVRSLLLCTAPLLYIAFSQLAVADLVVNGGFETGDFTGWTVNDPSFPISPYVGNNPTFAHSGNDKAYLGTVGAIGSILQTLVTTPGQAYTLSFWYTNDGTVPPNELDALWNGSSVFSVVDAPQNENYTNEVFTVVATGTSTVLEFDYRNDDDFFRLDDVSVTVPDSGSTILLAFPSLGLLCLVSYLRNKRSLASNAA